MRNTNFVKLHNDTNRQEDRPLSIVNFPRVKKSISLSEEAYAGLSLLTQRFIGDTAPADLLEAIGLFQLTIAYYDEIGDIIDEEMDYEECRQVGFDDSMDGYPSNPEGSTNPNLSNRHYDAYRLGYQEARYTKNPNKHKPRKKTLFKKQQKSPDL